MSAKVNTGGQPLSRRTFVGGSTALFGLGLTGVAAHAQTKSSPRRGGIMRVSAYANPSSLDPYTGRSGADQTFLFAIFDTLVSFDAQLRPIPGLAKWKFTDPRTMVLDINPGVLFHDGTACDAEAVKANLDRARTAQRSTVKTELNAVGEVEVTGPLQVTLKLKSADSNLPLVLTDRAGMMSSPKAVTELGQDYDRKPVGAGRFKFEQWSDNDKVVLTRFDGHLKTDEIYLDGVTFRIIPDSSAGVRSLVAGENDFMWVVPPRLMSVAQRRRDLTVVKHPSTRTVIMNFNFKRGPLQDLRVRQAVNHAIDRAAFARATTEGTGEVACGLAPKGHWAYDAGCEKYYPYDPAKSKALLAEAGFKDGCELDFIYFADSEYTKRADIVMVMLQKAGFKLKVQSGAIAQASGWMTEGKGDVLLTVWPGRADLTTNYSILIGSTGFYNVAKTTPVANIDELLAATRATDDIKQQTAAYATMMRAEREGALFCPICYEPVIYAHKAKIKGFAPSLLGKPKFDGMRFEA